MSQTMQELSSTGGSTAYSYSPRQLWWTLLQKERRETGYYGAVILLGGAICIGLGAGYGFSLPANQGGNDVLFGAIALARVFPLLIGLSCGAILFSLEKENGSWRFLRTLPVSALQVFWTKIVLLLLLILASCLLFWPVAIGLLVNSPWEVREFFEFLPPLLVSMVEATLWAVCFSLREKKVIHALIKASLGYGLVTIGVVLLAMIDIKNSQADLFYYWLSAVVRIGIGLGLLISIRRSFPDWLRDGQADQRRSRSRPAAITADPPRLAATWRRLVWLQWRNSSLPFAGLMLANLGIIVATSSWWEPWHPFPWREGAMFWGISIALIHLVAARAAGKQLRFLVFSGYSPFQIWTAFLVVPLAWSCLSAVLFYTSVSIDPEMTDGSFKWFVFLVMMNSLAAGQFAAVACRSMVLGLLLAAALTTLSYFLLMISLEFLVSQLATLFLLAGVPLLLVIAATRSLATTGRVGRKFWLMAPLLFGLALVPIPLLRIYEVPTADVEGILAEYSPGVQLSAEEMKLVRDLTDQLIESAEQATSDADLASLGSDVSLPPLDFEQVETALLAGSRTDRRDLRRFQIFWALRNRQLFRLRDKILGKTGEANYDEIHQAVFVQNNFNEALIQWWASHPRTSPDQIRVLIRRLEDEKRLFDIYRANAIAFYEYTVAATETAPREFPRLVDAYLSPEWIPFLPWEYARCRRNAKSRLHLNWKAIETLEAFHQKNRYGYLRATEPPVAHYDLVWIHLEVLGQAQYFWRIESVLYRQRFMRLYLALILWQREHDGDLPDDLQQLEGEILAEVPVSPREGEPFYLAREGITQSPIPGPQGETLRKSFDVFRVVSGSPDASLAGHPFIWINNSSGWVPIRKRRFGAWGIGEGDIIGYQRTKEYLKIRSIEEFQSEGEASLEIWFLPAGRSKN